MEVDVREVQGGGIAFSSVADGDRDYFNEAWLPTTHSGPWSKAQGKAKKLGYTFKGTTVGLAVPAYMDMEEISELPKFRGALNGEINGIESGAAVNKQARQVLENNNIEGFSVVASSGPATWQALESAIENREPIVVTAWEPHWKWDEYDLKYIQNARTGQTPVFGGKEDAFTIVSSDFKDKFPGEVVCFLQKFEASQTQVGSLMKAFQNRGEMSKEEAAAQWVDEHSGEVEEWTNQADECASSGEELEYLPDDATFSREQST
jgi:glycine betaine/proline transport system substrate-binding protein